MPKIRKSKHKCAQNTKSKTQICPKLQKKQNTSMPKIRKTKHKNAQIYEKQNTGMPKYKKSKTQVCPNTKSNTQVCPNLDFLWRSTNILLPSSVYSEGCSTNNNIQVYHCALPSLVVIRLQSAMIAVHPRTNTKINKVGKNAKKVFGRHKYSIMKLAEVFPLVLTLSLK